MESNCDADLVHLVRAGSRTAYDELVRRHKRSICGLAYLLLGDHFEAEDAAQEAFLRAWLNIDLLSDPAKFAPWLRRIVFGVSVYWLRVFRPGLYRATSDREERRLYDQPDDAESALARLEAFELRQRIWDAVARLPPRYRLPLTLFHLDGLSTQKVAEALGVPLSTVRSLLTRARQKLQPMLASYAAEVLPALEDVFQEQSPVKPSILHITDGESVAGTLRQSGVPGDISTYGDLMYEGPVPAGLRAEALREIRADFMAAGGYLTPAEAREYLNACDEALSSSSRYDEVVIWLDYRLSDQLILIRVLDWLSRHLRPGSKLSLICVGRYPGLDNFVGLGELTANQLASLADTRQTVSAAQFDLAQTAWNAFTSPDPSTIERLIDTDTSALPFLAAALRRHLEQFPSVDGGLSRTERQALTVLQHHGPLAASKLFRRVQNLEEQIFMGDGSFLRLLSDLSTVAHSLVRVLEGSLVEITPAGREILEGRADHIALNGIDRWLGGVHLKRAQSVWRWDRVTQRLRRDPM